MKTFILVPLLIALASIHAEAAGKLIATVNNHVVDDAGQGWCSIRYVPPLQKFLAIFVNHYSPTGYQNNSLRAFDPVSGTIEYIHPKDVPGAPQDRDNHDMLYNPFTNQILIFGVGGGVILDVDSAYAARNVPPGYGAVGWTAELNAAAFAAAAGIKGWPADFRAQNAIVDWHPTLDIGVIFSGVPYTGMGVSNDLYLIKPNPTPAEERYVFVNAGNFDSVLAPPGYVKNYIYTSTFNGRHNGRILGDYFYFLSVDTATALTDLGGGSYSLKVDFYCYDLKGPVGRASLTRLAPLIHIVKSASVPPKDYGMNFPSVTADTRMNVILVRLCLNPPNNLYAYSPATADWQAVETDVPLRYLRLGACDYSPDHGIHAYQDGLTSETGGGSASGWSTLALARDARDSTLTDLTLKAGRDTMEAFVSTPLSYILTGPGFCDTLSDFLYCRVGSLDTATATVSYEGLVTGRSPGTARVWIRWGEHSDTISLVIKPSTAILDSIVVLPDSVFRMAGEVCTLSATGYYHANADTFSRRLDTLAEWQSDEPLVATVRKGVVSLVSAGGPVHITASLAGVSGGAIVNVLSFLKRINFQVSAAPWKRGWLAEAGSVYSASRTYGWASTGNLATRDDRNGTNFLLKSFNAPSVQTDFRLDAPDGMYILRIGMGDNVYGSAGEQTWTVFGTDTLVRHAGASNTIQDNRVSVAGGTGLTLGVKGPINYLVLLSDEGIDMNLVADDNVTGVLPPLAVESAGKGRPGFALSAYPNPFNPAVTVRCFLPYGESAAYDIYNMQGKRVRSFLVSGKAGQGVLVWDGRDGLGKAVVSGLYFGRLQTSEGKGASHQLLLCR